MDSTREEQWKKCSVALFEILDKVGASEYVRRTRSHAAKVQEILISISQNAVRYVVGYTHIFGSSVEGSSTPDMHSDIDTVISAAQPEIVEHLEDIPNQDTCLWIIQDETTPPGYTKLMRVENKHPPRNFQIGTDDETLDLTGRPVIRNKSLIEAMTYDERNGPAGTTLHEDGLPDLDYVPAFRSRSWSKQAVNWLNRPRKNSSLAEDLKQYGFFVVSVGQPSSPERHLEWRISFSIQERKIMTHLSPTQFKCYVIMKMIKNDFIKSVVQGKSLTSYHCKTCLLYTIEATDSDRWTDENLVHCLLKCMNTLVLWLKGGFIPNYFIPEENMWKGSKLARRRVARILKNLMKDTPKFLTRIVCDNVGMLLQKEIHDTPEAVALPVCEEETTENYEEEDDVIVDAIIDALSADHGSESKIKELKHLFPGADKMIDCIIDSLRYQNSVNSEMESQEDDASDVLTEEQKKVDVVLYKWHYWALDYIISTTKELIESTLTDGYYLDQCLQDHRELMTWFGDITDLRPMMEFTKLDFQIVKDKVLPFLYTSLGSQLAVKALVSSNKEAQEQYLQESDQLLNAGHRSDALSGKVKHAGILFMRDEYGKAEDMLNEMVEDVESYIISWGRCLRKTDFIDPALCRRMRDEVLSTEEILEHHVAACVTYLPTEAALVPKELQYEMYRSTFATTPRDKHSELWFDFAVADAKICMYYLAYKLQETLGDERSMRAMMLFLIMTVQQELNLGHPETANNLLGCMFKQQGYTAEAWNCFVESWKLRPDHNAAKWHMCIMIAEAVAEMVDDPAGGQNDEVEGVEVLYKRKQ